MAQIQIKSKFYSLPDVIGFGQYAGKTVADVLELDPKYLIWASSSIPEFDLHVMVLDEAKRRINIYDWDNRWNLEWAKSVLDVLKRKKKNADTNKNKTQKPDPRSGHAKAPARSSTSKRNKPVADTLLPDTARKKR